VGQMRIGTVIGTSDTDLDLDLGVPGVAAHLPLPPAPSCAGHGTLPLPPPEERFRRGEHLSVRVLSLSPGVGTNGAPVRAGAALAHSVNSVAVRLLSEVGPGRVARLAERLGIPRAQVPLDLTQALGTALVSPLQLAGAYATFADTLNGRYLVPRIFAGEAGE